jgi:hypothetical protein
MTTQYLEPFGACSHFSETPREKHYVVLHPKPDFTGDCEKVFLACDMCRLRLIAKVTQQFNDFQNGEQCDVMQCMAEHLFPSFNQYTAPMADYVDLSDIPTDIQGEPT